MTTQAAQLLQEQYAPAADCGALAYFSSRSENTRRFVARLGLPASRIPLDMGESLSMDRPFVLVVPTYAGPDGRGAVPKQVIRFLNDADNRANLRGVIAAGNSNFGETFGLAGNIIAAKCGVPFLYRFELLGTDEDVANVRHGLERFWISRTH